MSSKNKQVASAKAIIDRVKAKQDEKKKKIRAAETKN